MSSNEWSSENSISAIIFSIREKNKSCNSSDGGGNSVGGGSSDVGGNIRLKNAWVVLNTNIKNFLMLIRKYPNAVRALPEPLTINSATLHHVKFGSITKQGCVFPMVISLAFRMEKYRVNDHPYHAPQFNWFHST